MINMTVVLDTKDNFSVFALVLHSIEMACNTQERGLAISKHLEFRQNVSAVRRIFNCTFKQALYTQPKIPVLISDISSGE